jgi:hypothetical protein
VPNLIKDLEENENILAYMKSEVIFLKTLFICLTSKSNYPVLRWLDYSPFIQQLPDVLCPEFPMDAVDRIFIAVTKNFDKELKGILPEKDMSRMMFYEALVRIAHNRFKLTG